MTTCDQCGAEAKWLAFAAYTIGPEAVHPVLARYPAPMFRSCDSHLTEHLLRDAATQATTGQWLVHRA